MQHSGGSQQLRIFRRAIRDGATLEQACEATGGIIGLAEGKIYLAADAKNPPPPEAYELIQHEAPAQETDMAKEDGNKVGEVEGQYNRPDAAGAKEIYDNELASKMARIATIKGDMSEPHKRIKDDCHFPRPVLNMMVSLDNMEDDKRDHFILALHEGLQAWGFTLPDNLITRAAGNEGGNVVPIGKRRDSGLAELAGEEAAAEFEEMTEGEMAKQAMRPSNEQTQDETEASEEAEAAAS